MKCRERFDDTNVFKRDTMINPTKLFVYGTLIDLSAQRTQGTILGRMFDCGWFPCVIIRNQTRHGNLDFSQKYKIHGEIIENISAQDLIKYDLYEGYSCANSEQSLYLRQNVRIETENKKETDCWIYLFNHSLVGMPEVTTGDWQTYIK